MGGTTRAKENDKYVMIIAMTFPKGNYIEDTDEWNQLRSPPCPVWGLPELARDGFDRIYDDYGYG